MSTSDGPTRRVADWIASDGDPGRFCPVALQVAAKSVVDTIGCMLGGTHENGPKALAGTLATDPGQSSTLIGLGTAASAWDAALVNGMLAHILDYDDTHWVSRGHQSSSIVATILSLAEEGGRSLAEMLEAYIVGLQVAQLVGQIVNPELPLRGYAVTSVIGIMGSTAAAARLLKLDATQTARALGIASAMASGVRAQFGTDGKSLQTGLAASGAVRSAQWARAGISASEEVLEAKNGFVFTLAGPERIEGIEEHVERLLSGGFAIDQAPPLVKLHACCHAAHSAIDAILALRPQVIDRLDSIEEIIVEGAHIYAEYMVHHEPKNGLEAKFSSEACAVIPLIDGTAGISQFTDASVMRPQVQAMLGKVRYHTTDRLQVLERRQMPGCVTIVLDDGAQLTEDVADTRGSWTYPCTIEDVVQKFEQCAQGVLSPSDVKEAKQLFAKFDRVDDVRLLTCHLRGPARYLDKDSQCPERSLVVPA